MVKEEKTNILNIIALILHGVLKQCFYSSSKIGRNPKDGIKFNNQYQRHQQYHRQLKHPYWAIAFNIHTSPPPPPPLEDRGIIQE